MGGLVLLAIPSSPEVDHRGSHKWNVPSLHVMASSRGRRSVLPRSMGVVPHGRTATSRGSRLPGRRDGARASPHHHRPRRVVQVNWVQGAPSSPAATPSPSLPGAPLLLASPPSPSLPAPAGGSSPPPLPSSWRVLYHAACSRSRMDAQPRGSVLAGASSSAPASAEALDIHERRRAAANLAALLPDCAVAQLLGSSVPLVLARSSQSVADSVITVLASWSSPTLRGVLYSLQGIMEYCGSRDIPMGDHEIDGSVTQDFLQKLLTRVMFLGTLMRRARGIGFVFFPKVENPNP